MVVWEKRRKERREHKNFLLPALLFFLLFSYVISGLSPIDRQTLKYEEVPGQVWVYEKKIWGTKKVPLEEYLIGMMAATIPPEYELETLKAQAVILRSYCVRQMEKKDGKKIIQDDEIKDYYLSPAQYEVLWEENAAQYEEKIMQAIEETKGMLIVSNGNIINPPFCRMSNGNTRDITEYVVYKEEYPYMKTVVCEEDTKAAEYIQYTEISVKEFEKKISKLLQDKTKKMERLVLYRDDKGYVKEVEIGEEKIDGESFRNTFLLASSCFSLEKIDDVIEIQTRGIGHGYGFSQYEADRLAKKGNTYVALLEYFFAEISLEKI